MLSRLTPQGRRRKAEREALLRDLAQLHDSVIAAVDAGDRDGVRALVAAPAAAELLDRGSDLYPSGHRIAELAVEETREGRARLTIAYLPNDPQPGTAPVRRNWRCARDDNGEWRVVDIARPITTTDTGASGPDQRAAGAEISAH